VNAAHRTWLTVGAVAGMVTGRLGAETVDPEQIKAAVQDVLARGPYRLEPSDAYTLDLSWIFDLIGRFLELIAGPIQHASFPVAMLIAGVLLLVLVALVAHIMYSFYVAMRGAPSRMVTLGKTALPNPVTLEQQAEQLAAGQNYVDATRTLFRAALARLELKRGGRMMLALTNSEYLRTFRSPWVIENLKVFVELINWKWYRDRTFDRDDYVRCKGAYELLLTRLNEEA